MGKSTKIGKSRKDKFYILAKQQGYRARSAFKLSQLASKFRLFDNVLHVIDLCGAPGGWTQVARKAIPMSGHIFTVDLAHIAPIPGATTIIADITTPRCQILLRQALRKNGCTEGKVELILNDGAPNVGTSWDHDAYIQNELVLKSLELTTAFLKPGGKFVTKVFRSADYTKLLFVMNKLFKDVTATKPISSRGVSAEIFVVCEGYLAPDNIAPEYFDFNTAFSGFEIRPSDAAVDSTLPKPDVESGLSAALKRMAKKHRSGYEQGDDFRVCSISKFFDTASPAIVLTEFHKISFDPENPFEKRILQDTPEAFVEAFNDLKIVHPNVFRKIINWRSKLSDVIRKEENVADLEPEKLAQPEDAAVEALKARIDIDAKLRAAAKKQERIMRKEARKRDKNLEKMTEAESVFDSKFQEDEKLFSAALIDQEVFDQAEYIECDDTTEEGSFSDDDDFNPDELLSKEEIFSRIEEDLEKNYEEERNKKGLPSRKSTRKVTRRQQVYKQWAEEMEAFDQNLDKRAAERFAQSMKNELSDDEENSEIEVDVEFSKKAAELAKYDFDDEEMSDEKTSDGKASSLVVGVGRKDEAVGVVRDILTERIDNKDKALFFGSDPLLAGMQEMVQTASKKRKLEDSDDALARFDDESTDCKSTDDESSDADNIKELSDSELPNIPLPEFKQRKIMRKKAADRLERKRSRKAKKELKLLRGLGSSAELDLAAVAAGHGREAKKAIQEVPMDKPFDEAPTCHNYLAEIQALGSLITKKKTRLELIDGRYNRLATPGNEKLPLWFKVDDDEARQPILPLSKEMMAEYTRKIKEISERPIRKVSKQSSHPASPFPGY